MANFNDDAGVLKGKMPMHVASWKDGDAVFEDSGLGELTDWGHGFAEIGFDYGDERVYVRFRLSDLVRATKEHDHG